MLSAFLAFSQIESHQSSDNSSIPVVVNNSNNNKDFNYLSFNEFINKLYDDQFIVFRTISKDLYDYNVFVQKDGQQYVLLNEDWYTVDKEKALPYLNKIKPSVVDKEKARSAEGVSLYDIN